MLQRIAIGLAVDAAILLLARYRDELARGVGRGAAVRTMLATAGQSVTYSNLTLVCGFSVGAISSFPPIRNFSVLTAGTIALTYVSAILLLPALLQLRAEPGQPAG